MISKITLTKMNLVAALAALSLTTACGKGEAVTVQMSNGSSLASQIYGLFVPSAMATVNSVTMCFKRLRFKRLHEEMTAEDNVDFFLGAVDLNLSGESALGEIQLPEGEYERVLVELEGECSDASGPYSIKVSNSSAGALRTDERITVRFDGYFDASGSGGVLNLAIQDIVAALDTTVSNADLKNNLEDASVKGTF